MEGAIYYSEMLDKMILLNFDETGMCRYVLCLDIERFNYLSYWADCNNITPQMLIQDGYELIGYV